MVRHQFIFGTLLLGLILSHQSVAFEEFEEFESQFGDYISLATGKANPIHKAPAIATLIRAEDIKNSAARDLDDLLERVPGLHVSRRSSLYNPIYTIRGIYSEYNQQVLFLINGQPMKSVYRGDRGEIWGGMPLNHISHIEILRGPGSALHGADAFSGVINIVTHDYNSLEPQAGISAGSFNTYEYWLQQSFEVKGWKGAISFDRLTSDGDDAVIERDLQGFFDGLFGSDATLAPAEINRELDNIDVNLSLQKDNWEMNVMYQDRKALGLGVGAGLAIDNRGHHQGHNFLFNIAKKDYEINESVLATTQFDIYNTRSQADYILFPEGSTIVFGSVNHFPDGVLAKPGNKEAVYHLKQLFVVEQNNGQTLTLGVGARRSELYDIKEKKNFNSVGDPLPALTDTSNDVDNVYILEQHSEQFYALIQDEIQLAPDWDLTLGVRYDNYSNIGDSVNPRAALVWMADYNLTFKWLYGRAFRAPSFSELYLINNPIIVGNENIDPEIIDTVELGMNWSINQSAKLNTNIYYFKIKDFLTSAPISENDSLIAATNLGEITGKGFEIEGTYEINPKWKLGFNYAYQQSENNFGDDTANVPSQQAFFSLNWQVENSIALISEIHWIGDRKRTADDIRGDLEGYTQVDLAMNYNPSALPKMNTRLMVKNVFDEDIREPASPFIADDLPMPGTQYYLELKYIF